MVGKRELASLNISLQDIRLEKKRKRRLYWVWMPMSLNLKAKRLPKFKLIFANQKVVTMILALDRLFAKLPHLPKKFRLFLTKIIPWLTLLGGVVSSIAVLLSFLLTILSLIALDLGLIMTMLGSLALVTLNALLLIKAFKPLRKHDAVGWIYLFWANVLGLVNSGLNIISGEIVGWQQISLTVVLTLLGFYLLFEIGQFYTYEE